MKILPVVLAAIAISGCGGDSGVTPSPAEPALVPTGGLWDIEATSNGSIFSGRLLIVEGGMYVAFVRSAEVGCSELSVGQVSSNSNRAQDIQMLGTAALLSEPGKSCVYSNGESWGKQSVYGNKVPQGDFVATETISFSNGVVLPPTPFVGKFNVQYNTPASIQSVVGTWTLNDGTTMVVDNNGQSRTKLFGLNCAAQTSIAPERLGGKGFNSYVVRIQFSACTGPDTKLLGATAFLIATVDESVSPKVLMFGGKFEDASGQNQYLAIEAAKFGVSKTF